MTRDIGDDDRLCATNLKELRLQTECSHPCLLLSKQRYTVTHHLEDCNSPRIPMLVGYRGEDEPTTRQDNHLRHIKRRVERPLIVLDTWGFPSSLDNISLLEELLCLIALEVVDVVPHIRGKGWQGQCGTP